MNWREILAGSTDLDINTDLLGCGDWCDENRREGAAMKLRHWAQKEILVIDEEPFLVDRLSEVFFILRSLFRRNEAIEIGLDTDTRFPRRLQVHGILYLGSYRIRSVGAMSALEAVRVLREPDLIVTTTTTINGIVERSMS